MTRNRLISALSPPAPDMDSTSTEDKMPMEASAPGSHGNSVQTSARLLLALSCDIRSTAGRLRHAHSSTNLSSSGLDTQEPPTPLGTTAQGNATVACSAHHHRAHASSRVFTSDKHHTLLLQGVFFFCAAQKYCSKFHPVFESPPELSFSTAMLFCSLILVLQSPFARIVPKQNCSCPKRCHLGSSADENRG